MFPPATGRARTGKAVTGRAFTGKAVTGRARTGRAVTGRAGARSGHVAAERPQDGGRARQRRVRQQDQRPGGR